MSVSASAERSQAVREVESRVRVDISAKYAAWLEVIKNYFIAREKFNQAVMELSQCRETLAGLKFFHEEERVVVHERVFKELEEKEAKFLAMAISLDVEDLPQDVFVVTPPHSTRTHDAQTEVPAYVDQYGTIDP